MYGRTFLIAATALAVGTPAVAQQRGTVEFGGFASHTSFNNSLGIDDSFGGGARFGAFVFPRLSVEFEGGGSNAGRTFGRQNINIGIVSARLTGVPFTIGPLSALLGAGLGHTDNHLLETGGEHGQGTAHGQSYGLHGLLGAKLAINDNLALRADWIETFASNEGERNRGFHVGLSVYRHPRARTVMTSTSTVTMPMAPQVQQRDSVSAAETRRLRSTERDLRALRDSLASASNTTETSVRDLATMSQRIHFAHDQSALDATAQAVLREKLAVFRANPAMRIVITGYASEPGTDRYNIALGLRRAEAARAFLISQGVDAGRIEIATRGSELLIEGPGEAANAANRRGEFRVQLTQLSRRPGM